MKPSRLATVFLADDFFCDWSGDVFTIKKSRCFRIQYFCGWHWNWRDPCFVSRRGVTQPQIARESHAWRSLGKPLFLVPVNTWLRKWTGARALKTLKCTTVTSCQVALPFSLYGLCTIEMRYLTHKLPARHQIEHTHNFECFVYQCTIVHECMYTWYNSAMSAWLCFVRGSVVHARCSVWKVLFRYRPPRKKVADGRAEWNKTNENASFWVFEIWYTILIW